MKDLEKKLNKIFIDFIIGGCYLGDWAHPFHDKIKKIVLDMYDHLMIEWNKLVKRRENDD